MFLLMITQLDSWFNSQKDFFYLISTSFVICPLVVYLLNTFFFCNIKQNYSILKFLTRKCRYTQFNLILKIQKKKDEKASLNSNKTSYLMKAGLKIKLNYKQFCYSVLILTNKGTLNVILTMMYLFCHLLNQCFIF